MIKKIIFGFISYLFTLTPMIFAMQTADKKPLQLKTSPYLLQRLKGTIKLDGLSNEPAWQNLKPFPVYMHTPVFGAEPSEKTEFLIAYDNNYIYVAGRMYDRETDKILASSKKRDAMSPRSDWFGILIDSFNDKENAMGFFTTPEGLRMDTSVFNDAQGDFPLNVSWNTFWDVACIWNEEGWFCEMRIPLSSLRFQTTDGKTSMGLIFWRYIPRKNEVATFPAISPKYGPWSTWKPSLAQEVIISGVRSRRPFYIAPYLLAGYGESHELNENETLYQYMDDPVLEAGIDIKYGITSNLTLDVTINTDFAQVEADDQQINLTRFSLFFPEKRLFFQERSSTFDFNLGGPNRLFYSRQIGIYDEKPVRIFGGARLVGRMGKFDLGFLSMQTAAMEDQPSENFSVLRLRHGVFNPYSYIGGMITSRVGMDGSYNVAYGIDGIFRLFGDDYLTINWAQTFEDGGRNDPFSLDPARFRIGWERRTTKGLGYNLSFSRAGADYNPGMGFEMRENYTRFGNQILYGWIHKKESPFVRSNVFLNGFVIFKNQDQSTESLEIGPGWQFELKSGYNGNISAKLYQEDVSESFLFSDDKTEIPIGKYRFGGLNLHFGTPEGRRLGSGFRVYAGSFYDGYRISLTISPHWSISSLMEFMIMYQINWLDFSDRNQQLTAYIAQLRLLATFSIKFSASAFIQYNSAVDTIIANVRFRFNPREGNDLYLVYNEGFNSNRLREVPNLPFFSSRTIMLKYTYTFNL